MFLDELAGPLDNVHVDCWEEEGDSAFTGSLQENRYYYNVLHNVILKKVNDSFEVMYTVKRLFKNVIQPGLLYELIWYCLKFKPVFKILNSNALF